MNIGIIGAGSIARIHAAAIDGIEGCRIHSVMAPRLEAAGALAGGYGAVPHDDLTGFLADPALDMVMIATPSGAHLEPCVAALRAGKHVACEKPLEISTGRIDAMMLEAERSGKTLGAILNRRFHPAMEAFMTASDRGRFGRMTSASAYVKWFRDQAYYDSAAWRGTWALDGGGALMNQSIHAVDALLAVAGPVNWVQARTECMAHSGIEVEDHAVAILGFQSGAFGVIEASTCCWTGTGQPIRLQVCGTGGSAFLADERIELWDFQVPEPGDGAIRRELMGAAPSLGGKDPLSIGCLQHRRNLEEILAAIRQGRSPSPSLAEARRAVELVEAIYQSARLGGRCIELGS